jgi:integrase/recombinase XerD
MEANERMNFYIEQVMSNRRISKRNKAIFKKYVEFLQAGNMQPASIDQQLYSMTYFMELLGKIDAKRITKDQMVKVVGKINTLNRSQKPTVRYKTKTGPLSNSTKEIIKASVKRFYKHLLGDDYMFPKAVAWIRIKHEKSKLVKSDLLTEDDVKLLLEHSKSLRDRAIISTLAESGVRIGELLSLRKKDIDLYSNPMHIRVEGKTGVREIGVVKCKPALISYLETRKELKPDDVIWRGERYTRGGAEYRPITPDSVRQMILRAAKEAGITKKVNPHAFRHAAATYNAVFMSDQELKRYHGWSSGSTMTGRYVHLADKDVDNTILKMNGYEIPKKDLESKLKVWVCTICKRENQVEVEFCTQCRNPRDVKATYEYEDKLKKLEEKQRWLESLLKLNGPHEADEFIMNDKPVEQIRRETESIQHFKEHQDEVMKDYIETSWLPDQQEMYKEYLKLQTEEERKKYWEWMEQVQEIRARREAAKQNQQGVENK